MIGALAALAWGLLAAAYIGAASGVRWPLGRTGAFVTGSAVMALAPLIGSLGAGSGDGLAWHMAEHGLILGAGAGLLALGAPVVLALRASRPRVRRVLVSAIRSRAVSIAGDPRFAWVAFVVAIWVTHLPAVIAALDRSAWLHAGEHLALATLAFGFWTCALNAAPLPRRVASNARWAYLLAAAAAADLAALGLMASGYPGAGAAMLGSMLPLAAAGVWSLWRWIADEEIAELARTETLGARR